MNIPKTLQYTKDHEWVLIEGQTATVGITEFAQRELGDIVYVDVDTIGDELSTGDTFGTVEAVKTVADLYMPLKGTVLEVNPILQDQPENVNKDPYGEGWMVKIQLASDADLSQLLDAEAYGSLVA